MKRTVGALAIVLAADVHVTPEGLHGQASALPQVIVGPEHVIPTAGPTVEPHLAVDPGNPARLLLGGLRVIGPGLWRVEGWRSEDGGTSWQPLRLEGQDSTRLSGDPWVGFGPDGKAYFSYLMQMPVDARRLRVGIHLHRSSYAGARFERARPVPWGDGLSFDHPTFAIDWSSGPGRGALHLAASQGAWTRGRQAVYRIGTVRWAPGDSAPEPATGFRYNNFNAVNGDVAVLKDGTVLYPYFEISRIINNRDQMLAHRRLWVTASYDAGRSFSAPFLVAEDAMGQFPRLAYTPGADSSRGRLYMLWRGTERDTAVYLSMSDDGGELWSVARRLVVGTDTSGAHWRTASIAVNRQGIVAVTWHEMGAGGDPGCFVVRAAISRDLGESFGPPVSVSQERSCPRSAGNVVHRDTLRFDVAQRFPAGGDYGALAAGTDATFHAVWADSRAGRYGLRHATIVP